MRRIKGTRVSATAPTYRDQSGEVEGHFCEPDYGTNPVTRGTTVTPKWCENVQEELAQTIEACGATLADSVQLPGLLGLKTGRLGNLNRAWYTSYSSSIEQSFAVGDIGVPVTLRLPKKILDTNNNCSDSTNGFTYTAQRKQRVRVQAGLSVCFDCSGHVATTHNTQIYTHLIVLTPASGNDIHSSIHSVGCSQITFIPTYVERGWAVVEGSGIFDLESGQQLQLTGQVSLSSDYPAAGTTFHWGDLPGVAHASNHSEAGCWILIEELPEIL